MSFAKRLIAVIGAPALLAGLILAGSASSQPTISAGAQFGKVTFTAVAMYGTSTFTLNSTACSLKEIGGGPAVPCHLNGAGGLTNQGQIQTANIAITSSKFGPISLSLASLHNCGVGSGAAITKTGPIPVVAITLPWTTSTVVTGEIFIFNPGNNTKSCESPG